MRVGLDSYSYRYASGLWGWRPGLTLGPEGCLRRTLELGLAGVHFADLGHFPTLEPAYLRGLRDQAERDGLYLELGSRLLATGQIQGEALITDCFPLGQVQAAYERFLEPSSVKVVVLP